jgi:electron transfer flavoprotein alpha subunit
MKTIEKVLVFCENAEAARGLSLAAHSLGAEVSAVVIGSDADAQAASQGVAKVYLVVKKDNYILEDHGASIKKIIDDEGFDLVLFKASKRTRLMAGKLAASLKTSVITDVSGLWVEDGKIYGEHMVYGGSALRVETPVSKTAVMLVNDSACCCEATASVNNTVGEVVNASFVTPSHAAKLIETRERHVESVNLCVAKHVVSVGRGIRSKEDLSMIDALAAALEAEAGCSRPIAEAEKWMSRERYIGVSGVMLGKPDIFFAIGVSGQVQHMVGANKAKVIFAVNKDKNSPIFKQVDYGLVADLYEAVPMIIERLKD